MIEQPKDYPRTECRAEDADTDEGGVFFVFLVAMVLGVGMGSLMTYLVLAY